MFFNNTTTEQKFKYKKTDEKPCSFTFSVEVPLSVIQEKQEKVTQEFQKVAKLDGFRPGKAPLHLVKTSFIDRIKSKTLQDVIEETVHDILKEKEINPVASPKIEELKFEDQAPLTFNLFVEINPEYKVKDYTKIPVKQKVKTITAELVDQEIAKLRDRNANLIFSEAQKIEKHHFPVIDYEVWVEDVLDPNSKGENQLMDLSAPHDELFQKIADSLVGAAKGDKKEVSMTLPADHKDKKYAGKTLLFKVTVQDIKEKKLPELDDEFAKDFGFQSLTELRAKIEEHMAALEKERSENDVRTQIINHLLEENKIPVPDCFVQAQLEHMIERILEDQRKQTNQNPSQEELKKQIDTLSAELKPNAEKSVRVTYLISGIAKQENLFATEEDLTAEKEKFKQTNSVKAEQFAAIDKLFEERRQNIMSQLTEQKVINFLKEKAKMISE